MSRSVQLVLATIALLTVLFQPLVALAAAALADRATTSCCCAHQAGSARCPCPDHRGADDPGDTDGDPAELRRCGDDAGITGPATAPPCIAPPAPLTIAPPPAITIDIVAAAATPASRVVHPSTPPS